MDKTVITPMSPVGKEAQTPSELESLREKFSPEELLSQLQKRIEVARNEKERREFSGLAEKLRAELSCKSEAIADQTCDAISKFRSSLSAEERSRLSEVESGMGKAFEKTKEGATAAKDKAAELAVQATEKVGGKEAADALKSGNLKEAASIVGEKVEFASKAAVIVANLDQMANEIESELPIFWSIIAYIIRFFAGLAKGFMPQADKDKMEAAKKVGEVGKTVAGQFEQSKEGATAAFGSVQDAISNLREAVRQKDEKAINASVAELKRSLKEVRALEKHLTPEQKSQIASAYIEFKGLLPFDPELLVDPVSREKWLETQLPQVAKYVSNEFYSWADLTPEQIDGIRKSLSKIHFWQDTIAEIRKRLESENDKTLVSVSDPAALLTEMIFGNAGAFWTLLSVVPAHRFVWGMTKKTVSEWMESYEYNVSLIFSKVAGIEPKPISFSQDGIVEMISSMKDQDISRDLMLMQMYRVNGIFASLLGAVASAPFAGIMAMKLDTSSGLDGLKSAKKLLPFQKKDFSGLAKEMERLEKAFPNNVGMANSITNELEGVRKNWLLLSLMQEGNSSDIATIKSLVVSQEYRELGITAEMIEKNSANLKGFFAGKFNVAGEASGALWRLPGKILGNASGIGNELIDHLREIKKFQYSLGTNDLLARLRQMGGTINVLKLPRMSDKALLHFGSMEDATSVLRQVASYGPGFVREFFHAVPTVGLVIGWVSLANTDSMTKTEKFQSFSKVVAEVLIPVVWPVMLLTDENTAPRITKEGEIQNLWTGLASLGLLTLDGVLLLNAARAGKIGAFFLERPRSVIQTVGNVARLWNVLKRATSRLPSPKWVAEGLKLSEKIPSKRLRVIAALWLGIVGGGYAYAKSHEDVEEALAKEGLWDKRTWDLTPKAQEAFANMDVSEKKAFCDSLLREFVEEKVELPHAKTDFHEWVYTVLVKTPADAKVWWSAVLASKSKFWDELARLWISVDVIDEETVRKMKEEWA